MFIALHFIVLGCSCSAQRTYVSMGNEVEKNLPTSVNISVGRGVCNSFIRAASRVPCHNYYCSELFFIFTDLDWHICSHLCPGKPMIGHARTLCEYHVWLVGVSVVSLDISTRQVTKFIRVAPDSSGPQIECLGTSVRINVTLNIGFYLVYHL